MQVMCLIRGVPVVIVLTSKSNSLSMVLPTPLLSDSPALQPADGGLTEHPAAAAVLPSSISFSRMVAMLWVGLGERWVGFRRMGVLVRGCSV